MKNLCLFNSFDPFNPLNKFNQFDSSNTDNWFYLVDSKQMPKILHEKENAFSNEKNKEYLKLIEPTKSQEPIER